MGPGFLAEQRTWPDLTCPAALEYCLPAGPGHGGRAGSPLPAGTGGSDEPELASAGQGRAQADLAIVHTIMMPKICSERARRRVPTLLATFKKPESSVSTFKLSTSESLY